MWLSIRTTRSRLLRAAARRHLPEESRLCQQTAVHHRAIAERSIRPRRMVRPLLSRPGRSGDVLLRTDTGLQADENDIVGSDIPAVQNADIGARGLPRKLGSDLRRFRARCRFDRFSQRRNAARRVESIDRCRSDMARQIEQHGTAEPYHHLHRRFGERSMHGLDELLRILRRAHFQDDGLRRKLARHQQPASRYSGQRAGSSAGR